MGLINRYYGAITIWQTNYGSKNIFEPVSAIEEKARGKQVKQWLEFRSC
jgi:hypothetical protein